MKKLILVIFVALTLAFTLGVTTVQSQPGRWGYGMGPGMMMGGWIDIPDKLPSPTNAEWVQKLREILTLEEQSLEQYQNDQDKFNAYMPYMMVIPQEENHIEWIRALFAAYGLPTDEKTGEVIDNKTLEAAYEHSAKMESDLLPRYEWLVKKAEDRKTAQVLNFILLQSRWHMVMFEHVSSMGHGYGYGMGSGMMYGRGYGYGMGSGMMGGRGYGYGRQNTTAIDAKEAESMMKDYLQVTGNPNLMLGKIKEEQGAFEAEIVTKNNDIVDTVRIDKKTGFMRSIYQE